MKISVLAFDFGASSGRAIKAVLEDGALSWEEVHRFENIPLRQGGHLRWNFEELMENVHVGIAKAGTVDSIGFDTWGLDFGLLDREGKLLENPVHYRDTRTLGIAEQACRKVPAARLYRWTGTQIMDMNTLFQLCTVDLSQTDKLLFMPDLLAYTLCGQAVCERSVASTSQMLDPKTGQWSEHVLTAFAIPSRIFPPLVSSGTVIGTYGDAQIIAIAGHDTQCAVAAMPTQREDVAFLSCGTWSLLGTELQEPILTERSKRMALSNELGANGKINYLKNIVGLWLIQESRRAWQSAGMDYSYAQLEHLALGAKPLQCFIDPDGPEFVSAGDIPFRVQEFCRKTKQQVPETVGEIMRCIYESLALKYRYAIDQLQDMTGKPFSALHILGGGVKDRLLCQMTANSTRLPVIAGPTEATALGNILIQLVALGQLESIGQGRQLLERSEKLLRYAPEQSAQWEAAYQKFVKLVL